MSIANTTVSIRERIRIEGRWRWSCNLRPPDDKLDPSEAERTVKFYLVWTERGKKHEQRVKGNFGAAVKAARAKERHLAVYLNCVLLLVDHHKQVYMYLDTDDNSTHVPTLHAHHQ